MKANQKLQYLADFFGLDRESQDALLALAKIWKERAAAAEFALTRFAAPPTISKPQSIDPFEWACYNEQVSKQQTERNQNETDSR